MCPSKWFSVSVMLGYKICDGTRGHWLSNPLVQVHMLPLKSCSALRCSQMNIIGKKPMLVLWNKNNQRLNTIGTYRFCLWNGTVWRPRNTHKRAMYIFLYIYHTCIQLTVLCNKRVYVFWPSVFPYSICVQLSYYIWSNANNYTTTDYLLLITSVAVFIFLLCKALFI